MIKLKEQKIRKEFDWEMIIMDRDDRAEKSSPQISKIDLILIEKILVNHP